MRYDTDLIGNTLKTKEDKQAFLYERRACSVIALSIAEDLPFKKAQNLLSRYRNSKHSIKNYQWRDFLLNRSYKLLPKGCFGFITFYNLEKLGILNDNKTYILLKRGHTFTIKNGVSSEKIHGKILIKAIFERVEYPLIVI